MISAAQRLFLDPTQKWGPERRWLQKGSVQLQGRCRTVLDVLRPPQDDVTTHLHGASVPQPAAHQHHDPPSRLLRPAGTLRRRRSFPEQPGVLSAGIRSRSVGRAPAPGGPPLKPPDPDEAAAPALTWAAGADRAEPSRCSRWASSPWATPIPALLQPGHQPGAGALNPCGHGAALAKPQSLTRKPQRYGPPAAPQPRGSGRSAATFRSGAAAATADQAFTQSSSNCRCNEVFRAWVRHRVSVLFLGSG